MPSSSLPTGDPAAHGVHDVAMGDARNIGDTYGEPN